MTSEGMGDMFEGQSQYTSPVEPELGTAQPQHVLISFHKTIQGKTVNICDKCFAQNVDICCIG